MNILTISSLYPNNRDFKHGIFVETRLQHLISMYPDIKPIVIAPVPWFPFSGKIFGEYAKYAGVKRLEERNGIKVYHPRYIVLPKLGMNLTPYFMAGAIKRCLKKLLAKGEQFDLIDGHYFFPDGVAIAKVAEEFRLPFTCTARGTDINLIPSLHKPRQMIQQVFKKASHMMTVCQALKDEMIVLGAANDDITVLRNGIDLERFPFADEKQQQTIKNNLNLNTKLILSVGWLIERKGHHIIIDALQKVQNATLLIAGDGPDFSKLEKQIERLGLTSRVKLLGALEQNELSKYYQAADVLVLASSREGWANVLLESMASGTPVVATKVWGSPEVVTCNASGILVDRNADSIAKGIQFLFEKSTSTKETRIHAENFGWDATSSGQYEVFKRVIGNASNE